MANNYTSMKADLHSFDGREAHLSSVHKTNRQTWVFTNARYFKALKETYFWPIFDI